jgi:hypothetical protein
MYFIAARKLGEYMNMDAQSVDSIVTAMYEILSGPAGMPRDWARFRALFAEGARLMPIVSTADRQYSIRMLSVEEFIHRVDPIFAAEDFWEREIERKTETVGGFAHVLSTYESLRDPQGAPLDRRKKSMQLFHDGTRWWILTNVWNTPRAA